MPKELSNALLINHPLELSKDEMQKLNYQSIAVSLVVGFILLGGFGLFVFYT